MKNFSNEYLKIEAFLEKLNTRKPDFNNFLHILRREKPTRPTLFEFIISHNKLLDDLTKHKVYDESDDLWRDKKLIDAYHTAGYDYACIRRGFGFRSNRRKDEGKASLSLNEGFVITDRESFNTYEFMEPEDADYTWINELADYLPQGMKLLVPGPDGIFETVLTLVGYDNLCYLLFDDPALVKEIFQAVGSRYLRYYENCVKYEAVGAMMADDDWGFKTQTFLSIHDMRRYVIPWHVKLAQAVHAAGKPITFHSCGNIEGVMEDVISIIKHDGWHSHEDNIIPIERAYDKYGSRIAILGGIDVDFLSRETPEKIYNRSRDMLIKSAKGGYALGSGNSIPDYIPIENYLAMVSAAVFNCW